MTMTATLPDPTRSGSTASEPTASDPTAPALAVEPAIAFDGVVKEFRRGQRALDDVTATFATGRITVLLGLSGSGKSTLLRHINGLHQPTAGHVRTLDTQVERAGTHALRALRRDVAMVFQHFNLVGSMTVLENVCTGRLGSLAGPRMGLFMYPRAVRAEAMEQLARVGLADRAFQRADTLSGGQQQRVAIARALIQEPKILLADEPVASLDPVSAASVIDLLGRISRESDLTVVCSLHQVEIALDFSDRIVGLQAGRVVLDQETAGLSQEDAYAIYDRVAHPEALAAAAAGEPLAVQEA
ncbi:phosphonate ABC transporter ATP-binding protein [Brevibacterium sp. BRM-1]|uniref:phosphonate ABC transporter ATP-binding protein n=1 Tax=Brevibacterium sp. BRM-1 TaxID=2999062 RepID=UPI002281BC24|nr:phosphonate ABC transporter ATP-binding protein [Brevibacterium sp. BRM-1]WAL40168.1 phosphonate ABC transporter ATP-binding protein [Brevibacterium sp. BRM-1]